MTLTELRAEAARLRIESRRLLREAKAMEAQAAEVEREADRVRREAGSLQRALEAAADMCGVAWKRLPAGEGPWVCRGIVDGAFVVGHPLHDRFDARYAVRGGYVVHGGYRYGEKPVVAQVDADTTLRMWRAWCAERKADRAC